MRAINENVQNDVVEREELNGNVNFNLQDILKQKDEIDDDETDTDEDIEISTPKQLKANYVKGVFRGTMNAGSEHDSGQGIMSYLWKKGKKMWNGWPDTDLCSGDISNVRNYRLSEPVVVLDDGATEEPLVVDDDQTEATGNETTNTVVTKKNGKSSGCAEPVIGDESEDGGKPKKLRNCKQKIQKLTTANTTEQAIDLTNDDGTTDNTIDSTKDKAINEEIEFPVPLQGEGNIEQGLYVVPEVCDPDEHDDIITVPSRVLRNTCSRCVRAKVKCVKCPGICQHCQGKICTECCKKKRKGEEGVECRSDPAKKRGRPPGSRNKKKTKRTKCNKRNKEDGNEDGSDVDTGVKRLGSNGEDESTWSKSNTGRRPVVRDEKVAEIDVASKKISLEPTYYNDIKTAVELAKNKIGREDLERCIENGWTEMDKTAEESYDDLADKMCMTRKALETKYKIYRDNDPAARNNSTINGYHLRPTSYVAYGEKDQTDLSSVDDADSHDSEKVDYTDNSSTRDFMEETKNSTNDETKDTAAPTNVQAGAQKGSDEEGGLLVPAITFYMTDGEALIQLKEKLGPLMVNDLINIGWNDNARTVEEAFDGITKLLNRNKEKLLRKYRILLQPTYYSTNRECLDAVKTKIGVEKMEYWKQQGWTESGKKTLVALKELASMMDMTSRDILAKYRIYVDEKDEKPKPKTSKRKAPVVTTLQSTRSKKKEIGEQPEEALATPPLKGPKKASPVKNQIEETEREGGPEAAAVKADGAKKEKGEQPEEALTEKEDESEKSGKEIIAGENNDQSCGENDSTYYSCKDDEDDDDDIKNKPYNLRKPEVTYYTTFEEAIEEVKYKMGEDMVRDMKHQGWAEYDGAKETALDDLAALRHTSRQELLEWYDIYHISCMKTTYYGSMRECLSEVKTKIGTKGMNYWKTKGWREGIENGGTRKGVEDLAKLMNIRTTELLEKYKIEANYKRKRETNAQEVVSERKMEAKAARIEEAKAARTEAVKAARAKEEKDQIEETEREGGPEAAAVKADGAKEEKGEQPEEPLEGPINASPVKKLWMRLSDIFDDLTS